LYYYDHVLTLWYRYQIQIYTDPDNPKLTSVLRVPIIVDKTDKVDVIFEVSESFGINQNNDQHYLSVHQNL